MKKTAVSLENIIYKYPDEFKAIKNLSFSIKEEEKVGLVGANGAGKSTILKLLTGLFQPQEGQIIIDSVKVNKKTLKEAQRKIGFIFQDSDSQLFMNNVYEDIAFGLRNRGISENEVNERIVKILKRLSIENLKDKIVYKLSGGQKRIVAIAGILVMEPKIMLMDEPTCALDPKYRRILINILKELSQTQIIATHDLDMIIDVCDRVIILSEGKIVADGRPSELLKEKELLESCNLELPLSMQGLS